MSVHWVSTHQGFNEVLLAHWEEYKALHTPETRLPVVIAVLDELAAVLETLPHKDIEIHSDDKAWQKERRFLNFCPLYPHSHHRKSTTGTLTTFPS